MLYTPCHHYLQTLNFLYETDSNNDCEILVYRKTIIRYSKRLYRVEQGQGQLKLGFLFTLILRRCGLSRFGLNCGL